MVRIQHFKDTTLPSNPKPNSIYWIKASVDSEVSGYITDLQGIPYPLKDLTLNFDPSDYDLNEFTNVSVDPFARVSQIVAGSGISSIQAGANITINNTDPLNPIVSVSGFDYADLDNIPSTFTPSLHTHLEADITDLDKYTQSEVNNLLDNKVDKVTGKGLSTEDYTTTEKTKLSGIEAGAEVNNISDVNATDLTDGGETNLHIHDSRYYTETEVDNLLSDKFDNPTGNNTQYLDGAGVPTTFPTIPSTATELDALKRNGSNANSNIDIGEYQLKAGQVELDQTPTGTFGVGKIRWNDSAGTAEIRLKGNNVTLQIGQELVKRIVNKTATNITLQESNYQVVKIIGATGQRLSVDLAQADSDLNSATAIGLVTETIANNQEGFITYSGEVNSINTTGSLQSETWIDGDILYLSPTTPGAITNIKPTAPNHTVTIGYVEYAHAINGKIFVKVDNGYELEELHNVSDSSYNSIIDADSLLIKDSSTSIWKRLTFTNLKTWLDTYFSATKIRSILGITTLSGSNTGDDATNTTSNAYSDAKVENNLTASTTIAPSKTVVNDALALKSDIDSTFPMRLQFATSSPLDSTTYYTGGSNNLILSTTNNRFVYAGITATKFRVSIFVYSTGTLGTSENVTFTLMNVTQGTTIDLTTTAKFNSASYGFVGLFNFNVTEGDSLALRILTPNFATNPTAVVGGANLILIK